MCVFVCVVWCDCTEREDGSISKWLVSGIDDLRIRMLRHLSRLQQPSLMNDDVTHLTTSAECCYTLQLTLQSVTNVR